MAVCYRHPGRETGVACSNCGRPICPDCMTPTPVGMRCPECSRQRTKVRRGPVGAPGAGNWSATNLIIVVNVIAFLAEVATGLRIGGSGDSTVVRHGALAGFYIADSHQYWRLLTCGFLHASLLHIAFNMFFIYFLGRSLEPALGRTNMLAVYFTSLLAGSFGALVFSPDNLTVGASGAGFGLLGALIVLARARGISIWESGLGATLVLNVVFTFSISGISIGGHLGGLVGGALAGLTITQLGGRRRSPALALGGCAGVAVLSVIGAVAAAAGSA